MKITTLLIAIACLSAVAYGQKADRFAKEKESAYVDQSIDSKIAPSIDCQRDLPLAFSKAMERVDGAPIDWTQGFIVLAVPPSYKTKAEILRGQAADKLKEAEQAEKDAAELRWLRAVQDKCGSRTSARFSYSVITDSEPPVRIPEDFRELREEVRVLRQEFEALKKPQTTSGAMLDFPTNWNTMFPVPGTTLITIPQPPSCYCCPGSGTLLNGVRLPDTSTPAIFNATGTLSVERVRK